MPASVTCRNRVGLDALHAADARLAWTSAALSLVLAAGSAVFYRYLR